MCSSDLTNLYLIMQYKSLLLCTIIILEALLFVNGHDYCDVLHKSLLFYEAQRSGRLPATNRMPWRGDSALGDCTEPCVRQPNGDGNLVGGYYDAGDGVKFGFPMAFTTTTIAWGFLENEAAITACGAVDYYLATIKWATDYFIKCHTQPNEFYGQVGNGGMDHAFWGPPEYMTMPRPSYKIDASNPGTDLAMETAAALAAASLVFRARNATYSATLLRHARELYSFGDRYRGSYSSSISDAANYYRSWNGFKDEIVWATSWLYQATGDASLLERARSDYYDIRGTVSSSFDWDNKGPGVAVLLAKITNADIYKADAQNFLRGWMPGGWITYTPGGLAWLREWADRKSVV